MRLTTVHKITIGTSVAFGSLFTAWSVQRYLEQSQTNLLVMACSSGMATVALFVYLVRFTKKLRKQNDGDAPSRSSMDSTN